MERAVDFELKPNKQSLFNGKQERFFGVKVGLNCYTPRARLHALQGLDHEQPEAVVDDLLERLAQVDARVRRGGAVPPLLQLTVRGQDAHTRGAVVRRQAAHHAVEKVANLVRAVRWQRGGFRELGHRAVDDHGREGEDKLHENLPLLSVVEEGAVHRVQRGKRGHRSLLHLVVELPDDGRDAGRVVQDERRGRVLEIGDLGDVEVDLGLARHGEQRVLHSRRGHLVRHLVEELRGDVFALLLELLGHLLANHRLEIVVQVVREEVPAPATAHLARGELDEVVREVVLPPLHLRVHHHHSEAHLLLRQVLLGADDVQDEIRLRRLLERVHDVAVGVQGGPVGPEHVQRGVVLLVATLANLKALVADEPVHVEVRALGHALVVALRLRDVVVAVLHDLENLVVGTLPAELRLKVKLVVLHAVGGERRLHTGEAVAHHLAEDLHGPVLLALVREVELARLHLDVLDRPNVLQHHDHHLLEPLP